MTVIIIGLVILLLITIILIRNQVPTPQEDSQIGIPNMMGRTTPDTPVAFGYKCVWFAVRTDQKQRLAEFFKLKRVVDCNWAIGIEMAYKGSVFISPPVSGWTLVCGWGLPLGDSKEGIGKVKRLLIQLAQEFREAQFFCTHRVTEYHCWMKATDGKIIRVYSYSGYSGENLVVEGEPTEYEKTLNLANTFSTEAKDLKYFDRSDLTWPNEETVMHVAGSWSVDPTLLEERYDVPRELGLMGHP